MTSENNWDVKLYNLNLGNSTINLRRTVLKMRRLYPGQSNEC